MLSSNAQSVLLILLKSHQNEKIVIPSNLLSFGQIHNYRSIVPTNGQQWTDALICELTNNEQLSLLDTKTIVDTLKTENDVENIFIARMIHSIDCIKDTSNDLENDVFFAVAFTLQQRIDQFPEDWFKATPYMSSCNGFKRATVYKVINDNSTYPYINIAIWSSLDSWKQAIATDESKKAHSHQGHVQRTPFIGKYVLH